MEIQQKTPEQISDWLRFQPWLGKFMKNCRKVGKISRAKAYAILEGKFGEHTLRVGFTWTLSPEGLGFWKRRNEEFKEWYYGNE